MDYENMKFLCVDQHLILLYVSCTCSYNDVKPIPS